MWHVVGTSLYYLTNTLNFQLEYYSQMNIYILLDILLCSIAEYFYELCRILASP